MKKYVVASALCLGAAIALLAGGIPNPQTVTLIWNTPTDQPWQNLTYRLYGTTNLTLPSAQWPLLQVITNPTPSASGTNLAYSISIQPGAWYFTMTASNMWGESPFCVPAATPPVPSILNNLQITKP